MAGEDRPGEEALALAEALRAAAADRPSVVTMDDAHWAGAALRDAFDEVLRRVAGSPVLWIEAHRTDVPDLEPTFPSNGRRLELGPLPRAEALALLATVASSVAPRVADKVVETAAGNPLFVVETARLLAERGDEDPNPTAIPTSIRALLGARLDSLPEDDRRVAECASVLGRTFSVDALAELLPEEIQEHTSAHVDGLSLRGTFTPTVDGHASFTHGSMREVAYGSLTKQRRAELHETAAGLLERDGATAVVLGHHLERAVELRSELGAADDRDRAVAERAASAIAEGGFDSLARADRDGADDLLGRALALLERSAEGPSRGRLAAGDLAFELGRWDEVAATLGNHEDALSLERRQHLGVALCKRARGDPDGEQMGHGRRLLEQAGEGGHDPDTWASLAGTWKGIDDARAAELYRRAAALDPGDPYAVGNVLELEIVGAGSLEPLRDHGVEVAVVVDRCRSQLWAKQNLPWAAYDLAKFSLLADDVDEALRAGALAVALSTAPFMLETSLASIERILSVAPDLPGGSEVATLLRLGLAGPFGDTEMRAAIGPPPDPPLRGPVLVIAGSSSIEEDQAVRAHLSALAEGARGNVETIVSGSTTQGVSALVGDLAELLGLPASGYVPATLPAGVELDHDPARYGAVRRTEGSVFGPLEPLAYWRDLIASGVPPGEVRVLAIGGGSLSRLEFRIALALGARVGVVRGSGGAAQALLDDPSWSAWDRLADVPPEEMRSFLQAV